MFRGVSALESEVTESPDFDVVIDEIRRWSSLPEDECQRFVSAEDGDGHGTERVEDDVAAPYPIPIECCFQADYVSPGI